MSPLQDAILTWVEHGPVTAAALTRKLFDEPAPHCYYSVRRALRRLERDGLIATWMAPDPVAQAAAAAERARMARGERVQRHQARVAARKNVIWAALISR